MMLSSYIHISCYKYYASLLDDDVNLIMSI